MFLALSFLVTACVYASVGFGGGSTYNALLALMNVDYKIFPIIALLCNLIVVTGGTIRFALAGHAHVKKILPWVMTSIPAAWLGGYVEVSEFVFTGVLGGCLCFAGLRLVFLPKGQIAEELHWIHRNWIWAPIIGAILGGIAGMVGIGGGIFLAPILHIFRWDKPKSIAAICSVFIFVNSIAGLTGQMMKSEGLIFSESLMEYWLLFPAVFIGGQVGSYLGSMKLQPKTICLMTGVLTLYVSGRLIWRWFEMLAL